MKAPPDKRSRGFTIVEVMIVLVALPVLFLVLNETILSGQKASVTTTNSADLVDALQNTLQRLSEELRASGRDAEDLNQNDSLDAGEDLNSNGRLEDDWSLTSSSITFNRIMADGSFSLPISYRLNGDVLERAAMLDSSGTQLVTILARSVTGFTVSESGSKVTIAIGITKQKTGGSSVSQTQSVTVIPRN